MYKHVESGHDSLQGRLAPGEYILEAKSQVPGSPVEQDGPAYAIVWQCSVCPSSLIAQQPRDTGTTCSHTVNFTVVPQNASGNTYQWRRNFTPLSNSAHITGATTASLTVNAACSADAGSYDVVVTRAGVVEPSRLAQLTIGGAGVDLGPLTSDAMFQLEPPSPNPSRAAVAFRYVAQRPMMATASVYDAAGRRIACLANRMLAGPGAFTWDGRTEAGTPVAGGLYFLRVNAGGASYVQRFVRMR